MARRSLRPHLNQIRGWVRQGRTDAWIAHQLEVTVQQIEAFKRENDLAPEGEGEAAGAAVDFDDEIDLRAEDDALIAAELEAEQAKAAEAAAAAAEAGEDEDDAEPDEDDEDNGGRARRGRRGRRGRGGGRRRTRAGGRALGGHFGPGRGGRRPVARPRRRGQPGLRGALGGPPAGRGDHRGRPDRHPPHGRRRRRRVAPTTSHGSSRSTAWSRRGWRPARCRPSTASRSSSTSTPTSGTAT